MTDTLSTAERMTATHRPMIRSSRVEEGGHHADAASAIAQWEQATGIALPADYRSFMVNHNGGRVFPLMFEYRIPENCFTSSEPVTFLDPLYDWAYVEDIWNGGTFSRRNPPGMLIVGCNPGGIEILLSMEPSTFGQIFLWLHSLSAWGEPDNNTIWPQADSFRTFMGSLYEDEDGTGYDYWYRPGLKHLERPLQF